MKLKNNLDLKKKFREMCERNDKRLRDKKARAEGDNTFGIEQTDIEPIMSNHL